MAIDLVTQYQGLVDEKFAQESKRSLVTNQNFSWSGARTIKLYKISTAAMNDYARNGSWNRYGKIEDLNATTEELTLKKDRSFTFVVDKMDKDETALALEAGSALERQLREVVIPEVDTYTYGVMCENAGHKPAAIVLTPENIYDEIITASKALDDALVPEEGRVIVVTPATYYLMKKCGDIIMETDIGADMKLKGVISNLDGCSVVKIAGSRLPEDFGFMMCHRVATAAPLKLEDYTVHENPLGYNGNVVEGRIYYDAFVLENKAKAIYYQAVSAK
ncbi:MAG: hypothetical protein K2N61_10010 [Lachnospiraceae bacterium]|nr:hypothetical protein [Lachnospiraceae bacterium]